MYLNENNSLISKFDTFPIILIGSSKTNTTSILVSTDEINSCKDLDEFIYLINNKLKNE